MQLAQARAERIEAGVGRFDQQHGLRIMLDLSLPSVHRRNPRDLVDAGGQSLAHQGVGDTIRRLSGRAGAEGQQDVRDHPADSGAPARRDEG